MVDFGDRTLGPLFSRSFSVGGFSMVPAPESCRFTFRARGAVVDTASQAFGVTLPRQACSTANTGVRAALWMGPDEWLLIGPRSEKVLIERQLTEVLAGAAHSLVDVSHGEAALIMSGTKTAVALAAGCPLDLHSSVFAIGMCTRTVLAKAQIVLWRTGPLLFYVQTSRSLADYVWRFLEQAGMDLNA
jgi:sarcosine oxidase, subunit gamma